MKRLTCEMCGSTEMIKQDGVFVCQSCGMKYSVEEAKKMMIEGTVDVQGTVKVDNSAFVEKYLANARRAKEKEDWEEVEKYYNMVEQNDPNNIEAIFYSAYGKAKNSLTSDDIYKRQAVFKVLKNCISVLDDNYDVKRVEENKHAIITIADDLGSMICSNFVFTEWKDGYGNVTRTNKDETIALFGSLLDAFRETIFNIQKVDDQPYIHEAAIHLYTVAKGTKYWRATLIDGWIDEEKKRLNYCVSKIVEKECTDMAKEDILDKAYSTLLNGESNLAFGYFKEYSKKNTDSPVGYLGKAVALLALDNYKTSANEVAFASQYDVTESDKEDVKRLIEMIASTNRRTLLVNAAAFANYNAVKFLVEAGSDVNFKAVDNKTALWHVAADNKFDEDLQKKARKIAQLLLDAGADATITTTAGVAIYNKKTDPEIASMIQAKFPNLEMGKSSGCYVATAVYGSYNCPEVWTLRRYRDYTLAETWYGRAFIKIYYAISPTLVKWFGHTEWFKNMWKGKLDSMVAKLQANGVESTPYEDKGW